MPRPPPIGSKPNPRRAGTSPMQGASTTTPRLTEHLRRTPNRNQQIPDAPEALGANAAGSRRFEGGQREGAASAPTPHRPRPPRSKKRRAPESRRAARATQSSPGS